MLGLARAAQYAGWGAAQGPNIRLAMTSPADMQYAVYQEPSYSWNADIDDNRIWNSTIGFGEAGQYSVSDVPALSNYQQFGFTGIVTVKLDHPAGLSENQGYKIFHNFRGGDASFLGNYAWVVGSAQNPTLVFNSMASTGVVLPGNNYLDYNNRWLTCVTSISSNQQDFADWNPGPVFGTTNFYIRSCVFDTETGELIGRQDKEETFEPRPVGWPSDLTQWIADGTADADGINSEGFGTEYAYAQFGGFAGFENAPPGINARIGGLWTSIGTMFDPLSATDRTWFTTRPNAVIESAVAWQNAQLVDVSFRPNQFSDPVNTFEVVYSTAEGNDRYSQQDNRQLALIPFDGTEALFDEYKDTTPIKSRG